MDTQLASHFSYQKLIRFCFPAMMMMIFTSIYGVVDGFFVSNFVGKTSFAAINLVMPFLMILGGFGFMIGTGGSALVAKTLGEKKAVKAKEYFTMMIYLTFFLGLITSLFGFVFIRPIAIFLGANEAMLEECVTYSRWILVFNTAYMLQNVFQSFFITADKPKLGLIVTVVAGLTNMFLDALLIMGLELGVVGAAIATGLSQCIGGILPLFYFFYPNDSLLQFTKTKLDGRILLKACGNGASELMNNISSSLVGMLYNFQLLRYAQEDGIAAYGVVMYVQFVFIAIYIGYAIGTAPIISYHYGAKNESELKSLLKKSMVMLSLGGVVMFVLARVLAGPLASVFVGYDVQLYQMTVHAFDIYRYSFILAGINIFVSSFFTALNNGGVSAAVSFLRTLVFQLLAVLLLPLILGLDGIWVATAIAEVFAFLISLLFLWLKRGQYHYF